jgi:hypothetical protein
MSEEQKKKKKSMPVKLNLYNNQIKFKVEQISL